MASSRLRLSFIAVLTCFVAFYLRCSNNRTVHYAYHHTTSLIWYIQGLRRVFLAVLHTAWNYRTFCHLTFAVTTSEELKDAGWHQCLVGGDSVAGEMLPVAPVRGPDRSPAGQGECLTNIWAINRHDTRCTNDLWCPGSSACCKAKEINELIDFFVSSFFYDILTTSLFSQTFLIN